MFRMFTCFALRLHLSIFLSFISRQKTESLVESRPKQMWNQTSTHILKNMESGAKWDPFNFNKKIKPRKEFKILSPQQALNRDLLNLHDKRRFQLPNDVKFHNLPKENGFFHRFGLISWILASKQNPGTCIFAYGLNGLGGRLCLGNTSSEAETEKWQKVKWCFVILSFLIYFDCTDSWKKVFFDYSDLTYYVMRKRNLHG